MLTFEVTELDVVRQRGLQASTFLAQPFWEELRQGMYAMIQERLKALRDARNATVEVKANLVDRWLMTEDLVARIERIPVSAVEAARELGRESNE